MMWSEISGNAEVMMPGEAAGNYRLKAEEFGVVVNDVGVFGKLPAIRQWASQILAELPVERHGRPLVTVNVHAQQAWLRSFDELDEPVEQEYPWEPNVDNALALMEELIKDPAAAGWTLADDVADLWANNDDITGDLLVGVELNTEQNIGIGEPLTEHDLRDAVGDVDHPVYAAAAVLALIAQHINDSY